MSTMIWSDVPTRTVDVGGVVFARRKLVPDHVEVSDARGVEQLVVTGPVPLNPHVASSGLDRSLRQIQP